MPKTEFVRISQILELPQLVSGSEKRASLMQRIEQALQRGGVQKLIAEIGKPLYIERVVSMVDALPDEQPLDIYEKARTVGIGEVTRKRFFSAMLLALNMMAQERMFPKLILTAEPKQLHKQLGGSLVVVGTRVFAFGYIEVIKDNRVPENVSLLIGTESYNTPDYEVGYALAVSYE